MSEEYKSNSNKSRNGTVATPERRVTQPVVTNAVAKKKSGVKKLADAILSDDVDSIKTYVVHEVVIPMFKNAIHDIITGSADRIFGKGDTRRHGTAASRINYRDYYDRSDDRRSSYASHSRAVYEYDDIMIANRADAEAVLSAMDDMLVRYRQVRVADLYDLVHIVPPHTAWDYVWTDLSTARVERVGNEYTIRLPRPFPVDR